MLKKDLLNLLSLILVPTGIATAEPQPWMKRGSDEDLARLGNPPALVYRVSSSNCGVSDQTLRNLVENAFTRFRVMPIDLDSALPGAGAELFNLTIRIQCTADIFGYTVAFYDRYDTKDAYIRYVPDYSGFGQFRDLDFLLATVADAVEEAISDYGRANSI